MVIKPRVRGFMCVTTHPVGCEANVRNQIDYVRQRGPIGNGPKRVLVIGASTGYGLASRIVSAFGSGASTLGVFFEKEGSEKRPGSAGWYNTAAFHKFAEEQGLYAKSINGDAFSDDIKQKTIDAIREEMGQVDLVVYSLAAPRRQHPDTGEVHTSTLKPIGKDITLRGLNTDKKQIEEMSVQAASEEEIENTVAVMGGDDWQRWIHQLHDAGLLAPGAKTTAFTYLGAELTWDIYWNGTIGAAKKDLDAKAESIRNMITDIDGDARVSVLKAVVTQASSAIPIMPLYLSLLFRVMKEEGTHEGCIEQIDRLFRECLYSDAPRLDDHGRFRVDDRELATDVQERVARLWSQVETDNIDELTDFAGYQKEFLRLFGFEVPGVDYDKDVATEVPISNLVS